MKKQGWLWAVCIAGAAFYGCSDDSKTADKEPGKVQTVCGNGVVESPEVCDDGNSVSGDGCTSDCLSVESDYECPKSGGACTKKDKPVDPVPGPGPVEPGCGNGVLENGEECDDGNAFSFDGCTSSCAVESGYECPNQGQPCIKIDVEKVVCGDGVVNGNEDCDDNNQLDGDGCDSDCSVEYGWECDSTGCHTVCGDGIIMGDEVCDDENNNDGDGCKADCSDFEEGFDCIEEYGMTYCMSQECGSGIINKDKGESCDYGEESANPNAPSYGWNSELDEPYCYRCNFTAFCGDGKTNSGEECDDGGLDAEGKPVYLDKDGNPIGGDGAYGGCLPNCKLAPRCGDNIIDPGEECDNGHDNSDTLYGGCTTQCKLGARCGDAVVQDNEVCDEGIVDADGKFVGGTGAYGHCAADCLSYPLGFCGDGNPDAGYEQCDLGGYKKDENGNNILDENGLPIPIFIDENGYIVGGDGSYGGCNPDCTRSAFCGDGLIDAAHNEVCDDGVLNNNVYVGGFGHYGGCNENCTLAGFCGDSIVDPMEQCDLGTLNNIGGYNGCNEDCTKADFCGDGVINGEEQCDNGVYGNVGNYEGCNPDCTKAPHCGDGIKNGPEKCDKGTDNNTGEYGGCNADCTLASYCGDGVVDKGEACDNGKLNSNTTYNGCTVDCKLGPHCGDDIINGQEQCDSGVNNSDSEYNGCTTACKWGPRCGDGVKQDSEDCDNGAANNDNKYNGCKKNCTWGPRCGDAIINGTEICDEGSNNGKVSYAGCSPECKFTAICGDGIVDTAHGEQCDDGSLTPAGKPKLVDSDGKPMGGLGNYGGCTAGCTKAPYCGDGIVNGSEKCDDGNTVSGDGCESNCLVITPKWECRINGDGKSECNKIPCGNGEMDAGEVCDDAIHSGMCLNCQVRPGFMCLAGTPKCPAEYCSDTQLCRPISDLFGDGVVQSDFEKCDDGNTIDNDGCTQGKVDPGYACLNAGERCVPKACGDGIRANGEECDDGNIEDGDGCSARCKREEGYRCDIPGDPCEKGYCGDGIVQYGEECDSAGGIGCSSDCRIEPNYECKTDGGSCQSVTCGDGDAEPTPGYTSYKECDDGDTKNGDGCSSTCKIEDGWHCETVAGTSVCETGSCGDGILDGGEECDDGNLKPADGCNPACELESIFECNEFGCQPICGDGLVIPDIEECDDGNLVSGDGCSSTCKIETGFECVVKTSGTPQVLDLPIVYHDFPRYSSSTSSVVPREAPKDAHGNYIPTDGYLTQELYDSLPDHCKPGGVGASYRHTSETGLVGYSSNAFLAVGRPDPDFLSYCPGMSCKRAVKDKLGKDGTPDLAEYATIKANSSVANSPNTQCALLWTCPEVFKWWYNDVPGINKRVEKTMRFTKISGTTNDYVYNANGSFLPLGPSEGYGKSESNGTNNGEFTSHFQTYFKFKGGEQLDFSGDDDVWVFFNGYLGVDVGGIHGSLNASVTLTTDFAAQKLHMYPGGIYAIDMFHAERCLGGSNYKMTLRGFLSMGTSTCTSVCGDGIVAGDEECDIEGHINDDVSAMLGCQSCKKVPRCGNGIVEEGETCDSGYKCTGTYASVCTYYPSVKEHGCLDDCTNPSCGNEIVDSWEDCDVALSYPGKHCLETCKFSVCGDGLVDESMGEECDLGKDNGPNAGCMTTCKLPYCGDGIVTEHLGEVCDDGVNDGSYGGCGLGCAFIAPYCGDGTIQEFNGEECDEGINNNNEAYGGCSTHCKLGASCGDGVVNGYEECDDGINNGAYGGCKADCTYAPRCGDGVIDSDKGEECDNGVANDDSAYGGCSASCKLNSHCGDGVMDSDYEACDKGSGNTGGYGKDKCNDDCTLTSYCGDGILDTENGEVCDFGSEFNNGAYGGCTADCKEAPYCGDNHIDSEYEQCDNGTAHNIGEYGGCTKFCTLASYCGDGITNTDNGEECDDGTEYNKGEYGGCTNLCKKAPYCGDGIQNGEEECDKGSANNTGAYNGCTKFCMNGPYCGDGIRNGAEECDFGSANNDETYGGCTTTCKLGPRCGDGIQNGSEACDKGDDLNTGEYGGCTKNCMLAPYCGDGIKNGSEECDFGKANNTGVYGGCNEDCTRASYCGDGNTDPEEQCDDGSEFNTGEYGKCAANCKFAPYCGDGIKNGSEQCDNGADNDDDLYNGCTKSCVLGPYCGDGIKNGSEQCDPNAPDASDNCTSTCTLTVN